jgi:hypothetical protein
VVAIIACLVVVAGFASCKKDDAKQIIAFSFVSPQATGVINESAKTITVDVPAGTDVSKLMPTIEVSEKAKVSPSSGVVQNFTTSVKYIVTAEDGSIATYTVTITIGGGTTSESLKVGQSYQGGIIAYIDTTGKHGFIAAPEDQSIGIEWSNRACPSIRTIDVSIGAGKNNTATIVAANGKGNYAAKLCDDLVLGGYKDWCLPSKDELNELFTNRDLIGGFDNSEYWSSSVEVWQSLAYYQNFSNGGCSVANWWSTDPEDKCMFRVRAIRYF